MSLRPLPDGALLAAFADPWLGVLGADDEPCWTHAPRQIDHCFQANFLAVSSDATVVEFNAKDRIEDNRLRFDIATLQLQRSADVDPNGDDATVLDGVPLAIEPFDISPEEVVHSASISFDRSRVAFGTEWKLCAMDALCTVLWQRQTPEVAWATNISGDGRLAVAAYGDGTIRWHRMEDGVEVLALFPLPDGENWVAWTPEGIYAATPGARGILRWHVNRGWDRAAEAIPVSDIPETFRPEVIQHVLPQMGTLGVHRRRSVSRRSGTPCGASPVRTSPPARGCTSSPSVSAIMAKRRGISTSPMPIMTRVTSRPRCARRRAASTPRCGRRVW